MVGPAINYRYNPGWTIQSGAYAPSYTGELSFNFQVMRQGRYRVYKGQPFASGMLVREEAPKFQVMANADADAFYLAKAARLAGREKEESPPPSKGHGLAPGEVGCYHCHRRHTPFSPPLEHPRNQEITCPHCGKTERRDQYRCHPDDPGRNPLGWPYDDPTVDYD